MYRLIIADDQPLSRNGLKKIVNWNELGFDVVEVFADGSEVLEYLESNQAEVLLLDVVMNKVSGLEVAKWIAQHKRKTKVVLISGYREFENARRAVEYGVSSYLLKPMESREIKEVFRKVKTMLDEEAKLGLNLEMGVSSSSETDMELIRLAEKYIENHLDQMICVDDIAENLFISKGHFQREFKRIKGITVMEYVVQIKMEKAKELLLKKERNYMDIAKILGYSDVKYFQKSFKKYTGYSMREYQRNLLNEADRG